MPNFKQNLQQLRIIHLAMALGPVVVLLIAYQNSKEQPPSILNTVGFGVGFVSVLLHRFLPAKTIGSTEEEIPFNEKFGKYRTYKIIQTALLESGSLINAVFYFLNKYEFSLYASAVLILLILLVPPTKSEFFPF